MIPFAALGFVHRQRRSGCVLRKQADIVFMFRIKNSERGRCAAINDGEVSVAQVKAAVVTRNHECGTIGIPECVVSIASAEEVVRVHRERVRADAPMTVDSKDY